MDRRQIIIEKDTDIVMFWIDMFLVMEIKKVDVNPISKEQMEDVVIEKNEIISLIL